MGYPTEIPNAIPRRAPPPARGPLARIRDGFVRLLGLFRRRKRRRADAPAQFGQGVAPGLPPLRAADRRKLDVDALARRLTR